MTEKELEQIRNHLAKQPVLKAYVFGSYARGDSSDQSDIDLLVTLVNGVSLFDFIRIKQDLEKRLSKIVDLFSDQGFSRYILPHIEKDKKLIYEQKGTC